MLSLIIVVAVVLIIAVAFTAYRVTALVDVVKKDKNDDYVPKSNTAQAVLGILFLVGGVVAFFYFSMKEYDNYNLPIASEHAVITERLFWITMAVTVFVFIITQIFLFGFGGSTGTRKRTRLTITRTIIHWK